MVLMWFGGSRKATLKAHPDKEGGTQEKMAAVNEAYEVLFNPGASPPFPPVGIYWRGRVELRQRFDNGEDPNDQTAQQQNPFAQGGGFGNFFQQGGGQQFFQQGHKFNVKFG
jgi:DnaJ family protein C protein 3